MLGAGGSSMAVIYSLIMLGCGKIVVVNRSINSLDKVKKHFKKEMNYNIEIQNSMKNSISSNACIINCTPYGTGSLEGKSPIRLSMIDSNHVLIDLNYNPQKTKFIMDGEKAGARAINGLDMLVYQGLTSIDIWMNKNMSSIMNSNKIKQFLLKEYA